MDSNSSKLLVISGEKYYSDDEIIVIDGDVSSRMRRLNDNNCLS